MNTYTRTDLIADLANRQGLTQSEAQTMLETVLDLISDQITLGNDVTIRHFGSFTLRVAKPRVGRNPKNPAETIQIPARVGIKFLPCREMKDSLANLRPPKSGKQ